MKILRKAVLFGLLVSALFAMIRPVHAVCYGRAVADGTCLAEIAQASGTTDSTAPVTLPEAGQSVCRTVTNGEQGECERCFNEGGAYTALGCFGKNGDPGSFITTLIQDAVGIGGGIAFLLILFAGFQTMTSTGNPEKLHAARELLGAAISGLLLIIFSLLLLRIIGIDILDIPDFGNGATVGGRTMTR